ncbi:MAG: hypothetical protein Q4B67_05640 [Eubacteriales bacterium]|nr:hypothetical protein [Eubacteriales bacterium]
MYKTTGIIDKEVVDKILKKKKPMYKVAMTWLITVAGAVYVVVALMGGDLFGAVMGFIMAALGVNSLFRLPARWKKSQYEAIDANGGGISFTTEFTEETIEITNNATREHVSVPLRILRRGLDTDEYIVLFNYREDYALVFKKGLAPHEIEKLKEHINLKTNQKFRWIR